MDGNVRGDAVGMLSAGQSQSRAPHSIDRPTDRLTVRSLGVGPLRPAEIAMTLALFRLSPTALLLVNKPRRRRRQ